VRVAAVTFLAALLAACAGPTRAPAVRGLPRDDRLAPLSAVWIGHATVLVRLGNELVITDPNLNGTLLVVPRETEPSVRPEELPRSITAAVISHPHYDHLDPWTLKRLPWTMDVLYPAQGEPYEREIPQETRRALAPWESFRSGDVTITAVPVRHRGGRYAFDVLWNDAFSGYVLQGAGRTVFFAGDTGYDPELFKEIGRRFPKIDLALIPIAPSRGKASDKWGHVDPARALDVFADVGADYMIPIHYEHYFSGRGSQAHGAPRRKLEAEVARRGLQARVFALRTGERWLLPDGAQPWVNAEVARPDRLYARSSPASERYDEASSAE
jgi:N-acyl-phosphatidylethanolamine-hydrolysing phospholipase D